MPKKTRAKVRRQAVLPAKVRKAPKAPRQRSKESLPTEPSPPPGAPATAPWSVSPGVIKHWTETQLTSAMRRLLLAEAYLRGVDAKQVMVNAEEKARDDGCDAWTPVPPSPSSWLGATATCWQFKAGKAGEPAKVAKEVGKKLPRATLGAGGRLVVVASGSARGKPGHDERLDALKQEALRLKIRSGELEVVTSESLASWLDEHPAVAGEFLGLPAGVEPLSLWEQDVQHRDPWFPTSKQEETLRQVAAGLDLRDGSVTHAHIFGRPGVGKTRFVLELCRSAGWRGDVLFIRQPGEVSPVQTLQAVGAGAEKRLVLVVDEAQREQVKHWAAVAAQAGGRLRLVTIGQEPAGEGGAGEFEIKPLEQATMGKVVQAWHPDMPREHVEFVAGFAGGYVKLARLAARAVKLKPDISIQDLLQDRNVVRLMDDLLQAKIEDRRALHVVAALASVGWEGDRQDEGRAIANHLGLDWDTVRARVHDFDRRLGIAPRAGDLRYISPSPLGVYLAAEAWDIDRDRMRSLPSVLPSDAARREYNERFRAVVASPHARAAAEEDLRGFGDWQRYTNDLEVERWAVLSLADPVVSARLAADALRAATRDQRLQIKGRARRELVHGLSELAWNDESFGPATLALAELANSENEAWGNNATGVFLAKFQMWLGGTARPYARRLEVVDDLLARPAAGHQVLAIWALAQVGKDHHTRDGTGPRLDAPRAQEWQPSNAEEYREGARAALARLASVALGGRPESAGALLEAAKRVLLLLRDAELRDAVAVFIRAVAASYPASREALGLAVDQFTERERRIPAAASKADFAWMAALSQDVGDQSPAAKVRRAVGEHVFRDPPDLAPTADLILRTDGLLDQLWAWLTSGNAQRSWDLGRALARREAPEALLETLLEKTGRGPDLRLIAGYFAQVAELRGAEWADDLLDQRLARDRESEGFVLEMTWWLPTTERGAARIAAAAERGTLEPRLASQLAFGGWSNNMPSASFARLLAALVGSDRFSEAALQLVELRVSSKEDEWPALQPVILRLLSTPSLVKAGGMTEHYWLELSTRVAKVDPRLVCRTLFQAHGEKDEKAWFLQHSQAAAVLHECIERDPLAVWEELRPYLEEPAKAAMFITGFPDGVIARLPQDAVMTWIGEDAESRAPFIARLVAHDLGDGALGSRLLAAHRQVVSGTMASAWATGAWWGEASAHWEGVADALLEVARTSKEREVRSWAEAAAKRFRKEAAQDRKREEEARVRRST